MRNLTKAGLAGALAVAMVAATNVQTAEARYRGAGALITGLVIGGIIAGAATRSYAQPRYYYAVPSECGEYRRRAIYNEQIGRLDRAQHWWSRYDHCRG